RYGQFVDTFLSVNGQAPAPTTAMFMELLRDEFTSIPLPLPTSQLLSANFLELTITLQRIFILT
uniref:hypothetical protein n=1 Tax=Megasphaera stantonii TaxID=2144175 RepID=UPI001E5A9C78